MIKIEDKSLFGMTFIDLFAGLGGFRLALESLGGQCVYSNEWDIPAQEIYKKNFGDTPEGDITKVDEKKIPNHDILCAGFPCQAFSISGKQRGFEDDRGTLFFDIARIIKEKKPKVVFLENVRNFVSHDNGRTIKVVEETMRELGYSFSYKILSAVDYGIPQKRERIYMVCFRNDLDIINFIYPKPVELKKHVEDLLLPDDDPEILPLCIHRDDVNIKDGVKDNEYSNKPIRLGNINKGGQGERIYSTKGVGITLSAYGGGVFAKTGGYLINGEIRKLHAYKQFGNSAVVDVLQYIGIEIGSALQYLKN